jgi:hypothetical protein
MNSQPEIIVRNTRAEDFSGIISVCQEVYKTSIPWNEEQLASHLRVFPEGQFVAVESDSQRVLGMSASLIVFWDDYDMKTTWRDFTGGCSLTTIPKKAEHCTGQRSWFGHPSKAKA